MAYQKWESLARKYDPLKIGSIDGTDTEPHDRAVVRAMNAKYKPNKGVQGNPSTTIFVGRLNSNTTEETLRDAFSYFGEIANIRLVTDIVTGFSKRYAFVEYESKHSASRAYQDAHKMVIDQHEILVDFEHCRTMEGWIPRRFGGGFGGKKESGQLRFGCRDRPFSKPIVLHKMDNQERPGPSHMNTHSPDRQRFYKQRRKDREPREYTREVRESRGEADASDNERRKRLKT